MKPFVIIFGILFLSIAGYVFVRGYYFFGQYPVGKWVYTAVYVLLFSAMLLGVRGADALPPAPGQVLAFFGYTFLLLFLYMGLAFLLIDVARIFVRADAAVVHTFRLWASAAGCLAAVLLLAVGYYKFHHPAVTKLSVAAATAPVQHRQLRIVMASDLHLGNNIGKKKAQQYVQLINAQQPDIVLLAGDIADRGAAPMIKQRLHEDLLQIRATHGVFGVPGNHDYHSRDRAENYAYYAQSGIRMLFDEAVLVDSSFYVLGRDDRTNSRRKTLAELCAPLDKKYPVLLLDHQPYALEEAAAAGIAMQFSGHTHNGQFFPGNLIVKTLFELPAGYKQKGNTHYYVSSGLGIWGPLYRVGTHSEVVVVELGY